MIVAVALNPPIGRREVCECGGEITSADVEARECTTCQRPIVRPTKRERDLAELSIALLRDGGIPDGEILKDYTRDRPTVDRVYEREYHKETGVRVAAGRVKLHMRRLLTH